jgi:hypothetical protein
VSFALFIRRCRTCRYAQRPEQVDGTCSDGVKLVDHANSGACPRDFYKAAQTEQQLLQQGYGPADPRFPGNGPCCSGK